MPRLLPSVSVSKSFLVRTDVRAVGLLGQHLIGMALLAWRATMPALCRRGQHVSDVGIAVHSSSLAIVMRIPRFQPPHLYEGKLRHLR